MGLEGKSELVERQNASQPPPYLDFQGHFASHKSALSALVLQRTVRGGQICGVWVFGRSRG